MPQIAEGAVSKIASTAGLCRFFAEFLDDWQCRAVPGAENKI
jgi:hypothetical protein